MPCSRWWVLPGRMISTRLTSRRRRTRHQVARDCKPGHGKLNGAQPQSSYGRRQATSHGQTAPSLGTEPSAQFRDQLISQVQELSSSDGAAAWAHKKLADKNNLTTADAHAVEKVFQARLEALGVGGPSEAIEPSGAFQKPNGRNTKAPKGKSRTRPQAIDKSARRCLNLTGCVTGITSSLSPSILA